MGKLLRNVVTQPVVGIQPLQASATVDPQSKISLGKEPSIHTALVVLIQVYLIAMIAAAMLEEVNAQVLLLATEPLTRDAPVVEQEGKCKCSLRGTEYATGFALTRSLGSISLLQFFHSLFHRLAFRPSPPEHHNQSRDVRKRSDSVLTAKESKAGVSRERT